MIIKFIFLSIAILAFSSCGEKSVENYEVKSEPVIEKFEPILVNDSLQPIIDSLASYNSVDDEGVGYGGIKSSTYKDFERLMEMSTNDELVRLTDHRVAAVRVYAFWALAKKKNPKVKDILANHLSDTSRFVYFSGCLISEEQVNQFYLNLLSPNRIDSGCFKLLEEEVEILKTVI